MGIRASGILLHPSSLPSAYGIGDVGDSAFRFADFLESTGQRLWQVLPLNATTGAHGHSPYHAPSAFAGDPLLIDPQPLIRQGLLKASEAQPPTIGVAANRVVFREVIRIKQGLLRKACERFAKLGDTSDFQRFIHGKVWLDDFALYAALRIHHRRAWHQWPSPLRRRQPEALREARQRFAGIIRFHKIVQDLFHQQWFALKQYCHRRRIRLIGDMPLYVPLDSADVWAHPHLFKLNEDGRPTAVSGVPPDYFSATGQLWGHPVYDWPALTSDHYAWWIDRMQHHLRLCDITRIDHFRGLVAYWEVPADAETAVGGRWVPAPVDDFFSQLIKRFGALPVIAEDLGTITPDVREVMGRCGFPGMRVLLFAFGDDFPDSSFLPHHHATNAVVYTGTHDNNTVRGWFETEADAQARRNLFRYLGREITAAQLPWELIRLALMSTADTAIIPLQDILGLGAEARMNTPAKPDGNWRWRFTWPVLTAETADRLREMTEIYGRL